MAKTQDLGTVYVEIARARAAELCECEAMTEGIDLVSHTRNGCAGDMLALVTHRGVDAICHLSVLIGRPLWWPTLEVGVAQVDAARRGGAAAMPNRGDVALADGSVQDGVIDWRARAPLEQV